MQNLSKFWRLVSEITFFPSGFGRKLSRTTGKDFDEKKISGHLAATALMYILVYVVEGHASACPRTGGVDKYGGVDIK